jgi:hypothetical protein
MISKKLVLVLIGFVFVSSIIFFTVSFLSKLNKKAIQINYAPSSAQLTIDGKSSKGGTVYLSKGSYKIKLSQNGWSSNEQTINTDQDSEVNLIIEPVSEDQIEYLNNNDDIKNELETVSGNQVFYGSDQQIKNYPFLTKLPLEGGVYTVGYGKKSTNNSKKYGVALYVSASEKEDRELALYNIQNQLGINPSDIEIIFEDYLNPFKKSEIIYD